MMVFKATFNNILAYTKVMQIKFGGCCTKCEKERTLVFCHLTNKGLKVRQTCPLSCNVHICQWPSTISVPPLVLRIIHRFKGEDSNIGIDGARGASHHLFVYVTCVWLLWNKVEKIINYAYFFNLLVS